MSQLQEALDELLQQHYTTHTPGAAILVARQHEIVYKGAAGVANMATGTPLTTQSNFRMASVSKQITAMSVWLLVQQDRLRLNDALSLYFPELAHLGNVQLHHLLNHTSGLPDFEEYIPTNQTAQLRDEEVLQITAIQQTTLFSPGTRYRYSNTGYVLLGLLVERVAGMAYGEFLRQNIFQPLQMHNSILYTAESAISNRALGYARNAAGEYLLSDQSIGTATRGDGCVYTSPEDYLKWNSATSDNNLFNIKYQPLNLKSTIDGNRGWYYSLGWFFACRGTAVTEYLHSGDTSGFTNLVIRLPQHDTVVACFSNIANNQALLNGLLQVLKQFPEYFPASGLVHKLPELTR